MNTQDADIATNGSESRALQVMLGETTIDQFFANVWQRQPALFRASSGNTAYHELIHHATTAILDTHDATDQEPVILFKHQQLLTESLPWHAAFLQGCSIVRNHADVCSFHIAQLCQDLQDSFPHAYANTYLTPPHSQTVPVHADDRDVLIVQVYGTKQWKVYDTVPIPFPYAHEQVGKEGRAVPDAVIKGGCQEYTLEPGTILYMPRGTCHQAQALDTTSFHVTIALATHDWSWASIVSQLSASLWHSHVANRRAVPRQMGRGPIDEPSCRDYLEQMKEQLHELTVDKLQEHMHRKLSMHNGRALQQRHAIPARLSASSGTGRRAAQWIVPTTRIRKATEEETNQAKQVFVGDYGLNVRDSAADTLLQLLETIRQSNETLRLQDLESSTVDEVTLVCFVRECVVLGALVVVE